MHADPVHAPDAVTPESIAARPDVASLSFEQAQVELEHVVEALEDRHTGLDAALALWERGEALHAHCQAKLDYAAERMELVRVAATSAEPAPSAAAPAVAAQPLNNDATADDGPTIF